MIGAALQPAAKKPAQCTPYAYCICMYVCTVHSRSCSAFGIEPPKLGYIMYLGTLLVINLRPSSRAKSMIHDPSPSFFSPDVATVPPPPRISITTLSYLPVSSSFHIATSPFQHHVKLNTAATRSPSTSHKFHPSIIRIYRLKMFSMRAPLRAIRAMPSPIAAATVAPQLAGRRFYHDKDESLFPQIILDETLMFASTTATAGRANVSDRIFSSAH